MNDEKKYNEIILSMTDSDGDIVEYELLDIVELDNIEYAVLLPLITFDKKVEIYVMKHSEDKTKTYYFPEKNNYVIMKVYEIFKEKYQKHYPDYLNFKD